MESTKLINIFIIGFSLLTSCRANNGFDMKYQWKEIDFNYLSNGERKMDIDSGTFIPANVIPVGIDVHEDRLFLSLPRLKLGVPASLAYINMKELTESERASPQLKPYPNWAAHKGSVPQIVSPFHIKVDSCQRLWAIDTGIEGILNGDGAKQLSSPRILIFNLTDDTLIRQSELKNIKLDKSIFSNIVVDDNDCDDSYAYVADAGIRSSLTVYSYKSDKSWQFEHHYFNIDPLAGNFSILGVKFQTNDGLYGLSLTEKKDNGFPVLYFHALTSLKEFNVSTAILRNETLANQTFAKQIYKNFTYVGSRRTNEQAGATAYHKSRHVFFYALPNMNEIGCSRINTPYNISNVFSSPVTMVYPSDVKIDAKDRVWVLSNNMQNFRTGRNEQANAANFYVQVAPINEAVKNTPCEQTFMEKTKTVIDKITGKGGASTMAPVTFMTFITSIAMLSVKKLLLH